MPDYIITVQLKRDNLRRGPLVNGTSWQAAPPTKPNGQVGVWAIRTTDPESTVASAVEGAFIAALTSATFIG